MEETEKRLVRELVAYLKGEGVDIKGARGIEGLGAPPPIANDGYGSARPHRADVVGFDPQKRRIVFGLVRPQGGAWTARRRWKSTMCSWIISRGRENELRRYT